MTSALIVILGETRKDLLIFWTYKANLLTYVLTLGFGFVGIGFLIGGGTLDPGQLAPVLLGYLVWYYAMSLVSDISLGLRGEIDAGTLEQMSMSFVPIGVVLTGRILANLITTTVQVFLIGGVLFLFLGIRIPLRWEGLPVLALTLLGVSGFGFMVAGGMLVFKRFESFANLIQNTLLFLNGSIVPVTAMPGWLAVTARTLPSTQGIVVLREVVLDGQSLASVWQGGSLMWLVVHSAIYLAIGWLVFTYCERVAKEQGSLGQY
jgi:ABC-2 type transport system permease protein